MMLLFCLLCLLVVLQLAYPFVTILLDRILKGRTGPFSGDKKTLRQHDFACIVTAYRNVEIARPLVESLLQQTHPTLMVYLVADECPSFDFGLQDNRFVALVPASPLRLKAKSLIYAMERFQRPSDYVAVFDADNLAHPQFLEEINRWANAGYRCIQGQRTAKNLDTTYAALDSLGEHYKNYIEREVPFRLGSSAVISGSGMATETSLYKAYLQSPEIEAGKHRWKRMLQEDKILQNFLLRRNERIAYAREAIVYDEKVETADAVETQRGRWLYSYFQNIPNAMGILWRGISGLRLNQWYFGFVTLALPMFLQLGLALGLMFLALFIAPVWSLLLLLAIALFACGILWALYLDAAPAEVWRALRLVPKFILRQFFGLFKMLDPNKHFKHTEHRKLVSLKELEENARETGSGK